MNQKQVLVEYLSNVNTVIKHPVQFTQRIKFTCFDVSQNYIVFGATSGGIYVFNRYPHAFIKLIPSKHGSVVQISVSSNEKAIALATSKGLVIVIQNCFGETNAQYQIYTEHERNLVTAIKWHGDDLYCGDNKGRISVIILPNLLTKAIFQTPCASLMQLDSNVVQIDCYSKFLLISTNTRTYICDTDKEQYRQIGKKLRDGRFGACFVTNGVNPEVTSAHASTSRGLFKNMKDDEQFIAHINDNVKIFCTRPGARMWEAKLDASVARTHQFKNFLKREPTSLLHVDDDANAHLKITNFSDSHVNGAEFNYSKVFILGNNFIFTFNPEGFYVFDPKTVTVICWCNYFSRIRDVKIIKNFIYIWNENCELQIVTLYDLEKLVLKTLFNKQYYLCSELCLKYNEDVLKLVETSEKIHLVSILKEKLTELQADDLIENLLPLFKAIQEFTDKKCNGQKLMTGIVVVNNPYRVQDAIFDESVQNKDQNLPETLQALKEIGSNVTDKLTESTKNLKEKLHILEATVKNLTSNDVATDTSVNKVEQQNGVKYNIDYDYEEDISETKIQPHEPESVAEVSINLKLFYQQYEATKINSSLEVAKFNELLLSNDLNAVMVLFLDFKQYMLEKNVDETNIKIWCYKHYLKHVSKRDFKDLYTDDQVLCFLSEAFRSINFSPQYSCTCLFPLPLTKACLPDFYDVGCAILKKFRITKPKLFEDIHKEVPFMWKFIITCWKNEEDINSLLPLLIQLGDEDLLGTFLIKFKYDTWDDAVQLLIKLKKNICVNCDNNFNINCDIMSWTKFGTLMVQSIGGSSTISLLMRYANIIPSYELDTSFYQSCIFATATDNLHEGLRDKAINLTKTIQSEAESALQFDKMMAKFLQKKYMKSPPKYLKNGLLPVAKTDLKCSFCDLPIDVPVLHGVKLKCNHLCHTICLIHNKNVCKKCDE